MIRDPRRSFLTTDQTEFGPVSGIVLGGQTSLAIFAKSLTEAVHGGFQVIVQDLFPFSPKGRGAHAFSILPSPSAFLP
jgi:hypothetical protein